MAKKQSSKKPTKKGAKAVATVSAVPAPKTPRTRERDPRLPPVGSTIVRRYKGVDIRVKVLEDGFGCEGAVFTSLSALAAKITEQASINGYLFFQLTGPRTPKPESAEKPAALAKARAPKAKRAGRDPEPAATDAAPETAPAAQSASA